MTCSKVKVFTRIYLILKNQMMSTSTSNVNFYLSKAIYSDVVFFRISSIYLYIFILRTFSMSLKHKIQINIYFAWMTILRKRVFYQFIKTLIFAYALCVCCCFRSIFRCRSICVCVCVCFNLQFVVFIGAFREN